MTNNLIGASPRGRPYAFWRQNGERQPRFGRNLQPFMVSPAFVRLPVTHGLRGLDSVGCDLVEISPPYDHGDITSILASNLVFEYLSLLTLKKEKL
jgi:hypothetical protein